MGEMHAYTEIGLKIQLEMVVAMNEMWEAGGGFLYVSVKSVKEEALGKDGETVPGMNKVVMDD